MSEVTVRALRPDDVDAVLRLSARLTTGVAAWRDVDTAARAFRRFVEQALTAAGPASPVFVADRDGEVVGFAAAGTRTHWAGEVDAYLEELAVDASVERGGVGRQLVDAVAGWARGQGYRLLTLETGSANVRARGFYERLGFAEEEVRLTLEL